MFPSLFFLVALVVAVANAAVVPRAQPANYDGSTLEPYDVYHARYTALSCQSQHDTQFFADCCHPLLKDQPLSSRPASCNPAASHPPTNDTPPETDGAVTGGVSVAHVLSSRATAISHAWSHSSATYFFQNGVAGACGRVHGDYDLVCAMGMHRHLSDLLSGLIASYADARRYGDTGVRSPLCGRSVRITNTRNGKSVDVYVADACPTCLNSNSIDLSMGAFERIADLAEGEVPSASSPVTFAFLRS